MRIIKPGDRIFIREDLKDRCCVGDWMYIKEMGSGWKKVRRTYDDGTFSIEVNDYRYTPEMVDWDKTDEKLIGPVGVLLSEADNVNSPKHYELEGLGIEVIDIMKSNLGDEGFKNYCKGNVIKYVLRAEKKNGLEDYKKAAKYLNWIIEAADGSKQ